MKPTLAHSADTNINKRKSQTLFYWQIRIMVNKNIERKLMNLSGRYIVKTSVSSVNKKPN